jgi:hypothetical protein
LGGQETVGSVQAAFPFELTGLNVQYGTFSCTGTATGTQSDAIAFSGAFATATDLVLLTYTSLGGAVVNGGPVAASVTANGFTATVDVTTAGTGAVTGYYVAFGH